MVDVADRDGVSTITVSRALKAGSTAPEATRRRIMQAVDDLGYVLDQTAGALSSKRSGFVAVLIPSLNDSNFSDTARGIGRRLEGRGLQMLLGATDDDRRREEELIEAMLRRRPEGVVVTGAATRSGRGASSRRPACPCWRCGPCPSVRSAMWWASPTPPRRPRWPTDRDTRGTDRRRGCDRAVRGLGLAEDLTLACGAPPISMEQGSEAVVRLVERRPDVGAVICVSDLSPSGR